MKMTEKGDLLFIKQTNKLPHTQLIPSTVQLESVQCGGSDTVRSCYTIV